MFHRGFSAEDVAGMQSFFSVFVSELVFLERCGPQVWKYTIHFYPENLMQSSGARGSSFLLSLSSYQSSSYQLLFFPIRNDVCMTWWERRIPRIGEKRMDMDYRVFFSKERKNPRKKEDLVQQVPICKGIGVDTICHQPCETYKRALCRVYVYTQV